MSVTFDAAWRHARLAQRGSLLRRRRREDLALVPLDDAVAALGHQGVTVLGRVEVPVEAIVGTVSRLGDFDRNFRPRNRYLRERWGALEAVGRDLPPVDLIQLGELFFVEDGHHRVAIARMKGIDTIHAQVRRIRTIAYAHRCLTLSHLPTKAAERMFLERVPLPDDIRAGLWLDEPSDWHRLADAAEAWACRQHLTGRALADRCELAEAWWTEEVSPVVEQIRRREICVSRGDIEVYLHALTAGGNNSFEPTLSTGQRHRRVVRKCKGTSVPPPVSTEGRVRLLPTRSLRSWFSSCNGRR